MPRISKFIVTESRLVFAMAGAGSGNWESLVICIGLLYRIIKYSKVRFW